MKQKRLKLQDIKVVSFITNLEKSQELRTLKGGITLTYTASTPLGCPETTGSETVESNEGVCQTFPAESMGSCPKCGTSYPQTLPGEASIPLTLIEFTEGGGGMSEHHPGI